MKQTDQNFNHSKAEQYWYQHWLDKNYFHSEPDERESYAIVIPPPNVTGVLHMGHCLNNTIQDILVRRARMQGKNACWVPGTDHASIATEAKVVAMLRERNISKSSIGREEFLKYAWEWKEKYGGIILQQLKKLGCSLDWERTTFTMDEEYYKSVMGVFNDLYKKGYIYRGHRMIHWDSKAKTALSDEEVIYKETRSQLVHLKYTLDTEGEGYIIIATQRPETIMGDTAICVHPGDERYKHLHGKFAFVPLINRRIPIITDEYVTTDFGTGALKVTPAHDMNDYTLGQKHGLESINILQEDGTLNEAAQIYIGEDRFAARKKIIKELEEKGILVKKEDYTTQIGHSERTDVVVEPRLSLQWWMAMKKIAAPALKAVMDEEIRFYPAKFKNTYRYWMENIKDWCISRQLWWGHRIPAWYDEAGNVYVAASLEALHAEKPETKNLVLKQDEDVLDTWFSSWLWPFEVFKGFSNPGNKDVQYYYPTQTLVTAPEIIFFWVARMIMSGFEYMDGKPFSNVYFTGIVRDEQGRKMSKQLGNSPELLGLIDKYGADAIRFGILISSPAGNDLLFDVKEESTLKQGSFFINKLWNAMKLVKIWEGRIENNKEQEAEEFAVQWFQQRLHESKAEIESLFAQFKLSEALKAIYTLIWDDFCSWYLEWIKPGYEEAMSKSVYDKTVFFFDELLQILHPFMPFVTEEIYHELKDRNEGDDICVKQQSPAETYDNAVIEKGRLLKNIITLLRDARNKSQLKPKDAIELYVQSSDSAKFTGITDILKKQVNAISISGTSESIANAIIVTVEKDIFYIITNKEIDTVSVIAELEKELLYQQNFLQSVEKKLGNERFVQNAKPEVVVFERKKQADAQARITTIQESLKNLQ